MLSFDRVVDALATRECARRTRLSVRVSKRWACVLLLPALACARGVRSEELDASRSGITVSDAGMIDAAMAAIDAAATKDGASRDAALIDQGATQDAAAKDAGTSGVVSCAAINLCVTPNMAGTVSGDTGSDSLEITGSTSTFVSIDVSEDDHTPLIPKRMRMGASLNSPGADFDLFLLADGCASALDSSEGGFTESVDLTWDDTQGEESARKLILEVRHKTGACDPARPWVLTIRGN